MKVYIAEFRPYDLKTTPFFWKLVLDIVGTNYYHTGMVIGNRYFEAYDKGYRELKFTSFEQLNKDRGQSQNPPDAIDFVLIPKEFSQEEIDIGIKYWQESIDKHLKFGFIRFAQLAFSKLFRWVSENYYKKTGKVLIYARTDAEKNVRVCSSSCGYALSKMGFDPFPELDETIVVPGWFAKKFGICWKK